MLPVSGNTTVECGQCNRCSAECHHTLERAFFGLALIMHNSAVLPSWVVHVLPPTPCSLDIYRPALIGVVLI